MQFWDLNLNCTEAVTLFTEACKDGWIKSAGSIRSPTFYFISFFWNLHNPHDRFLSSMSWHWLHCTTRASSSAGGIGRSAVTAGVFSCPWHQTASRLFGISNCCRVSPFTLSEHPPRVPLSDGVAKANRQTSPRLLRLLLLFLLLSLPPHTDPRFIPLNFTAPCGQINQWFHLSEFLSDCFPIWFSPSDPPNSWPNFCFSLRHSVESLNLFPCDIGWISNKALDICFKLNIYNILCANVLWGF